MKITEITWENGRKYKDENGYIWEVDTEKDGMFNTIDGVIDNILNFYHFEEIFKLKFEYEEFSK